MQLTRSLTRSFIRATRPQPSQERQVPRGNEFRFPVEVQLLDGGNGQRLTEQVQHLRLDIIVIAGGQSIVVNRKRLGAGRADLNPDVRSVKWCCEQSHQNGDRHDDGSEPGCGTPASAKYAENRLQI